MSEDRIEFKGVDKRRWADLEALFEARGGPHNCWCMVWRDKSGSVKATTGSERKSALKGALYSRVSDGGPVGILGYCNGIAIAWCSIAPRSSYRPLGGVGDHQEDDFVWSVACFFISRKFRGKHIADRLLQAAIDYARDHGARIVEVYPVDPDSSSALTHSHGSCASPLALCLCIDFTKPRLQPPFGSMH